MESFLTHYKNSLYILLLTLTMAGVSCTSSSSPSPSAVTLTEHSKIIEVSIPSYSNNAIIAMNISKTNSSPEESGPLIGLSLSSQGLHALNISHEPPVLPDLPKDHSFGRQSNAIQPLMSTVSPQFSIDSLTHETTTYNFVVRRLSDASDEGTKSVLATLKYGTQGSNCLIYLDDSVTTSFTDWETLGNFCDASVSTIITTFVPDCEPKTDNNCDVDGNQKDIVLYYSFTSSISGYVHPIDLLDAASVNSYNAIHSTNHPVIQKEILHLNSSLLDDTITTDNKQTLAHEYQHIVSNHQRIKQGSNGNFTSFETWIEEGLADSASHICLNAPISSRLDYFTTDPNLNSIRNGIGFIKWTSQVENYTLSYLFFQYCRIHSNLGNGLFNAIQNQTLRDYQAVENAMSGTHIAFGNFDDILRSFHIATVVNSTATNSIYGFKDEPGFNFTSPPAGTSNTTKTIYPGGRVIMYPDANAQASFMPSDSGDNIRFYRINTAGVATPDITEDI